MEGGKRGEAGTSAGGSWGCGGDDERRERQRDVSEKPDQVCEEEAAGDDDDDDDADDGFVPGPLLPLNQQLEKDKEDESLRRWKEKLLGSIESNLNGQTEPEVKFQSVGIISEDFGEIVYPLDVGENQIGRIMFTLREGSHYQLKLKFTVMHNIVSGLTYSNTAWKGGLRVDRSKGMLGTFAPHREPYEYILVDDITPSGVLARGIYSAKLKGAKQEQSWVEVLKSSEDSKCVHACASLFICTLKMMTEDVI
ncbi:rho GDP-dissociation inhibitor 1-like isoform X2 [Malania oleifera]|uniref:rho GDP-dissociation inhibitor 1-like isoform X2 n=1 Tax=Malania oleifera TaxID=397392 RepID=UPI0025AEA8A6|nr:rho GDP-dissociation inhibitor 1-like isoform X2 [Malania oleifera]